MNSNALQIKRDSPPHLVLVQLKLALLQVDIRLRLESTDLCLAAAPQTVPPQTLHEKQLLFDLLPSSQFELDHHITQFV